MAHARVVREPQTVMGLAIRTSNETAHEIGGLWQRFMSEGLAAGIPGRIGTALVAVYCEYEGDHTAPYTFLLGCPVEPGTPAPQGFETRDLPAGSYTCFAAEGEQPQALMETWAEIWGADITRAFAVDYEVHDPSTPERVEIFISSMA
jgi:predicted transcriptional regulator YdeE